MRGESIGVWSETWREIWLPLQSQCAPVDPALWATERYRDFLQLRRAELANRMNAFISEKAGL